MSDPDAGPVPDALESVIRQRRSCRGFTADVPPRYKIERILDAGMHAPYAQLACLGREDFRRFFVFRSSARPAAGLREIVHAHARQSADRMAEAVVGDPAAAKRAESLIARMSQFRLPDAPWIVIVAEPRGTPPVAPQSIAHCMQNMWLMVVALGLGMQLISIFESMGDNAHLCSMLGLPTGEWALNGCAVGTPVSAPPSSARPDTKSLTTWFD